MKVISLFSGAGGLDLGFEQEGFVPIVAIDKDQASVDTYNHNRESKIARKGDLSKLTGKDIIAMIEEQAPRVIPRGVIGGPPCQSFSQSNVHSKSSDSRHKLPFHYASILKSLNRKYYLDFFVFENVTGLKSNKHKERFEKIIKALEDAGFHVFEQVLDASWYGVAQNRRRIFVVGINRDLYPHLKIDLPIGNVFSRKVVKDVLAGLPEPTFYRRGLSPSDISYHPNHWTMNPKSNKFSRNNEGPQINGRSFRQLKWERPSLTIAYGHREIYVHPNGHRRLSIFESMRLQGFPDCYELLGNLSQQVNQISDAVPPPLAAAVAKAIKQAIYEPIEETQKRLLDWFSQYGRDFPWRKTSDPYAVLLAEKLLQQTSVNTTVVEIYKDLLERYPSVESLAKADVKDLSKLIKPLGFKYRARELINLAQSVVGEHGGRFPSELGPLIELPGVGDYIARAVLCFAFQKPVPIVDTNVARLLYRLFGLPEPFPLNPARNRRLINLASNFISEENPKDYNLAVLDFCAAICTVSSPKCEECPLLDLCHFGRSRIFVSC